MKRPHDTQEVTSGQRLLKNNTAEMIDYRKNKHIFYRRVKLI